MLITGEELDLPLLIEATEVRNHVAQRLLWHSHAGVELIFLVAGATTYEFEGNRTLALPGGHFLVVPARTQHRGLDNLQMPSELACLTFNLRGSRKRSTLPFTRPELEWMAACFEDGGAKVYPFGDTLRMLIQHLKPAMGSWNAQPVDLAQKASLRTIICACILEAAREVARRSVEEPSGIVEAAVMYLRAHLDEPLQVAALAEHLGFSRARVFDLFTTGTGMPPHKYLLRLRLEKAMELLRNSGQSITEIAYATGFASGQHFSRVFRKYHGETPHECRNAVKGRPQRSARGEAAVANRENMAKEC